MLYIEVFLNGLNPGVMPRDKLIMIILVTVILNRIVVVPGLSPGVLSVQPQSWLQNSPYFCVFKYARAVKQKAWNEAENRERDWGETRDGRVRLARFARVRLLRHALPISLLILRKKPTVLQSTSERLYMTYALHLEPKLANTRLISGDEYAWNHLNFTHTSFLLCVYFINFYINSAKLLLRDYVPLINYSGCSF